MLLPNFAKSLSSPLHPRCRLCLATGLLFLTQAASFASAPTASSDSTQSDSRYGLWDMLDHRSSYGTFFFPEPILVGEMDVDNELRVDWFHTKAGDTHGDEFKTEIEKSFGLLTLELDVPYERQNDAGVITQGFGNIELAARHPVYQYVSANGLIDSTLGVMFEVGIPTNSPVSKNTEIVPKIFNTLRIGDHFTIQSLAGYSMLLGGGDEGGLQVFEYGIVFGYSIPKKQLPIPGVLQLVPIFEIKGERELNGENAGKNSIVGDIGLRADLRAIGPIQPRPGVAFVFPMNGNARADMHWGVVVSMVFEY